MSSRNQDLALAGALGEKRMGKIQEIPTFGPYAAVVY